MPIQNIDRAAYGVYNNPVFGPCTGPELISLMSSTQGLGDVLRFLAPRPTTVLNNEFFSQVWVGTDGTAAAPLTAPISWHADPCATAVGAEWGGAMLKFSDFGTLRIKTPQINETRAGIRNCFNTPMYYANGQQITDDVVWGQAVAVKALMQDMMRALIVGNKSSSTNTDAPEQFDGLQRIIKQGYVDSRTGEVATALDSIVVNYNSQQMCPPAASPTAGVTWNGVTYAGLNLLKAIQAGVRIIRQKLNKSSFGRLQSGDMALLMPSGWVTAFLDCVTCDIFCASNNLGLTSDEARRYRETLNGGLYGQGQITIDNMVIPIIEYDQLENANGTCDMYLITAQAGGNPCLQIEYNDMTAVVDRHNRNARLGDWESYDQGLTLFAPEIVGGTCVSSFVSIEPRMVAYSPWAQMRISSVAAPAGYPMISFDPTKPNFIEQNLVNQATPLMPI
jgi:hypothetical protein